MTNYEKLQSESWNSHAMTEHKLKKGIGAKDGLLAEHGTGVTFADSLRSFTAQDIGVMSPTGDADNDIIQKVGGAEDGNSAVPEGLSASETIRFCRDEYLKSSIGADPQDTKDKELHKLTKEQREWLELRHDLEELKNGKDAAALGALMGDMVSAGIIAPQGAAELAAEMTSDDNIGLTFLEIVANHIERQERYLEYLKEEVSYPERTEAEMKYLKQLIEVINNKKECYEAVWQLFDGDRASEKPSVYENRVQDVSEQLKADFGSMLA